MTELNQTARTFFPKEYLSRKQNFQKASCAKWPLPSCRKLFHIFGGKFEKCVGGNSSPEEPLTSTQTCQNFCDRLSSIAAAFEGLSLFFDDLMSLLVCLLAFQRQPAAVARRQLPRRGGYQLDSLDFRGDARGWRLDMDMVIIYIYSVNWVVGFFVFCFLCYLFFPSF